ncbi:MAG: hypothetical protein VW600_16140 [Ferrovibrio sp.]
MAKDDKPAADASDEPLSAQRQRTAKARAAREARLAASLRANIARRKQQVRHRAVDETSEPGDGDDPVA